LIGLMPSAGLCRVILSDPYSTGNAAFRLGITRGLPFRWTEVRIVPGNHEVRACFGMVTGNLVWFDGVIFNAAEAQRDAEEETMATRYTEHGR
jgi:hypothetical protein